MTSLNLTYLFKDLISKYCHDLRYRGVELQHVNLEGRDIIEPVTWDEIKCA